MLIPQSPPSIDLLEVRSYVNIVVLDSGQVSLMIVHRRGHYTKEQESYAYVDGYDDFLH